MLFVSGLLQRQQRADSAGAAQRMASARRTARGSAVVATDIGPAHLLHAQAGLTRAAAGTASALLWRPAAEENADDAQALTACVGRYAEVGEVLPANLAGAFVMALIDAPNGRAALVTDRYATCQLYFRASAEQLSFATDADVVAADPAYRRALDPQALYDYMFFHCIPSPRTIYREIHKVPPASVLRWEHGALRTTTWWLPSFAHTSGAPDALARELRDRLEAAVARRVRPACGAFLSGGLDSSSVVAMLSRRLPAAPTFTIGFDAAGYDESRYAQIAASSFNTDHHEYFVTPRDVRESIEKIAAHYGEPFGNSSVIPTYHCARFAREHGIELMFAGDGGDELFAGNKRYVDQQIFETYARVPAVLRAVLEGSYRLLPWLNKLPLARKGAHYIEQANMGLPDRLQSYNFLQRFAPNSVFERGWLLQVDPAQPWLQWRERYAAPATATSLQRMLYLDWKYTLADNDLVKVGRMCDLAGVNVVYPMLDDAVVDLSTRLSREVLLRGGELRGFYKDAFAGLLPRDIITKPKHGFGLPFGLWMRSDRSLQELVAGAFSGMRRRAIFAPAFLDDTLRLFREDAASYYGELVWIVLMLELWLATHGF